MASPRAPAAAAQTAPPRSWFAEFCAQTRLLMIKNFKLHARNRMTTAIQLGIGLVFLSLIVIMQAAVSNNKQSERTVETLNPTAIDVPRLQPCRAGPSGTCHAFVFAPNDAAATALASEIIKDTDIPAVGAAGGPRAFASPDEIDAWLVAHPNVTALSLIFDAPATWAAGGGDFGYTIQANKTRICENLGVLKCTEPELSFEAAAQLAVDTAIVRLYGAGAGAATATISARMSDMPHQDSPFKWDVMQQYGTGFLYICIYVTFVVQVLNIVREKETHLREAMVQAGLLEGAYWASWMLTNLIVDLLVVLVLIAFGAVLGLDYFVDNAFGNTFFLLLLCAFAFSAFAMLFSTLVRNSNGARGKLLLVFIILFLAAPTLTLVYFKLPSNADEETARTILSLMAPFPFVSGSDSLVAESSGETKKGLAWEDRDKDNTIYTLEEAMTWLTIDVFMMAVVAWYLDNVTANEYGVRAHPLFFLMPSYWRGSRAGGAPVTDAEGAVVIPKPKACPSTVVHEDADEDVRAEEVAVRDAAYGRRSIAMYLSSLRRVFTKVSTSKRKYCDLVRATEDFRAVDDVSMAVNEGELFVMLGHNGAGKSTVINMLVGLLPASGGDATIFGHSVRTQGGMDAIRSMMGVCPQHDVLFEHLSGREHLEMFARLKRVPEEDVAAEATARLADVDLDGPEADMLAGNYSGGMRRRLSIAIAMIGSPRIVFLDEPTTGMDPISRAQVWKFIERAKKSRVMILTTHSMEEADVLGDRISIFSHGRLKAVGTSIHLKSKYGAGYRVTMFVKDKAAACKAVEWVAARQPAATLVSNVENCLVFVLPRDAGTPSGGGSEAPSSTPASTPAPGAAEATEAKASEDAADGSEGEGSDGGDAGSMAALLEELEAAKGDLGVTQYSLAMSTLEDTFIRVSDMADLAAETGAAPALAAAAPPQTAGPMPGAPGVQMMAPGAPAPAGAIPAGAIAAPTPQVPAAQPGVSGHGATGVHRGVNVVEALRSMRAAGGTPSPAPSPSPTPAAAAGGDADSKDSTASPTHVVAVGAEGGAGADGDGSHSGREVAPIPAFSFANQTWALVRKNIAFQKRQKGQVAAIVCFPAFIVVVLLLLQVAVFEPLSKNATDGIDVACMQNLTGRTFTSKPTISVVGDTCGVVTGGLALGGECTNVAINDFTIPFVYDSAPAGATGASGFQTTSTLRNWRFRLIEASNKVNECEGAFQEALDDNRNAKNANDWELSKAGSSSAGSGACYTGARLAEEADAADRFKPTDKGLADLKALKDKRSWCEGNASATVLSLFDNSPAGALSFSVAAELQKVSTVTSSAVPTPFVGGPTAPGLRFGRLADDHFGRFEELLVAATQLVMAATTGMDASAIGAMFAGGPTPAWMPTDLRGICSSSTAVANLTGGLMSPQVGLSFSSAAAVVGNLCAYRLNIDAVRGTHLKAYAAQAELHAAMMAKTHATPGAGNVHPASFMALHLRQADVASGTFAYTAYYNNSVSPAGALTPYNAANWPAILGAVDNAIVLHYTGRAVRVRTKNFPVRFELRFLDPLGGLSFIDFIGSGFLPYMFLMLSYVILSLIVFEKQERMRMMMVMSGLRLRVYWIVNYVFYLAEWFVMFLFLWLLGAAAGMQAFVLHDAGLLLLVMVVWGNVVVAYSFMLSTFFNSQRTATAMSFLLMLICIEAGGQVLLQLLLDPSTQESSYSPLMWMPPVAMVRLVFTLALSGAFKEPITMDNMGEAVDGSVQVALTWLGCSWFVLMFLFWYLEQVMPSRFGVREHPLFCLRRRTWQRWAPAVFGAPPTMRRRASSADGHAVVPASDSHEDLAAESRRVMGDGAAGDGAEPPYVRIMRLTKRFPLPNGTEMTAVRDLTLGFNLHEVFGLLGSNGAGKTTTINVLTGLYPPTQGDATVGGLSIREDFGEIHMQMAVAPQHDILWESLTAREHCEFYARLSNFKGKRLDSAVDAVLASVNLGDFAHTQAGKFSGGMKRRLTFACALVSDPRVAYLDEPSTGLDPRSRRDLWTAVAHAKDRRSLVLTTHSMEEAEVLSDRIGIMAHGMLQCVDTPAGLKARYGAGYTAVVATSSHEEGADEAVAEFVRSIMPSARLLSTPLGGTSKFEVARADVNLAAVFKHFEANRRRLNIVDFGLSETSMEEVLQKVVAAADKALAVEAEATRQRDKARGSDSARAAVDDV